MALAAGAGEVTSAAGPDRGVPLVLGDRQVIADVAMLALTMVAARLVATFLLGSDFNTWPARIGWDMQPPMGTMFAWAPIPAQFKHLGALLWVALGLVKGDDAPGCEVRTPEQIGRFLLGNHVGRRRGGCGLDAQGKGAQGEGSKGKQGVF